MATPGREKIVAIFQERQARVQELQRDREQIESEMRSADSKLLSSTFHSGPYYAEYLSFRKKLEGKLLRLEKLLREAQVEFLRAEERLKAFE